MPLEDFTTYTDVDPNNHIGLVGTNHIDFVAYMNEDAYLYKDKDVDHFGTSWEHKIDVKLVSATSQAQAYVWALANLVDDFQGIVTASGNELAVRLYYSGTTKRLILTELYLGTIYDSIPYIMAYDTPYYLLIKRDGTALTCKIYDTAAHRDLKGSTGLLATPSLTLHDGQPNHRYIYASQTANTGNTYHLDCDIENLDLQEEAGATAKSFSDVGGGSDGFLNPYRAMPFSDTGHGAEAFNTPFRSMGFADVGAGIDVFVIPFKTLGFADVGYGTDAFIVLLQKSFADAGSGLDAFVKEVLGFLTKNFSDVGQGVDVFAIPFKGLGFSDSGHGVDVFIIPFKALGFSDVGYGTDTFLIVFKTVFFSDASYGNDSFGKYIPGAVKVTKLFLVIGDLAIQISGD
jgi:hypothetical protein